MLLFTFYNFNPLPPIVTNDEIFPAFIVRSLPHGIAGLVIAAIFAAAMSNLSASLNSLASTTVIDFYVPLSGGRSKVHACFGSSRWLTAAWGVALIGIAILARGWGSVFTTGLTIASIVYGPMLGAFLLGRLSPRANSSWRARGDRDLARHHDPGEAVHSARVDVVRRVGDGGVYGGGIRCE